MADIAEFMRGGGPCEEISRKCKTTDAKSGCACAVAADEIERLRKTVMDLCVRNDKLGDIITAAVTDYDRAPYIEDVQFDWIDAAREAIGRKPT